MQTTQFGFTHVEELVKKPCPCADPGNYVAMITIDGIDFIECWCGRRTEVRFDDNDERQRFIDKYRGHEVIRNGNR